MNGVQRMPSDAFDIRGVLITDVEEGQPCLQCGDTCSGFSPHSWRKNCTSCKCPRDAHDVCHEEWVSVRSRLGLKGEESSSPVGFDPREKGLAWAPPGLPAHKVEEYFSMLPEISVPRLDTTGERYRDRQLAYQLPKQDLARAYCRHLNPKHASSADDFMAARNEIALDIGNVQEVLERDLDCGGCHTPLKYGSLAVSASKLGLLYHPACFRCMECKELLVDLAYCVHDDTLFCERHYAEQLKPRCAACDESDQCRANDPWLPNDSVVEKLARPFHRVVQSPLEMGLMLSVLVGCVGVLELLACLRHVSDGVVITINQPATPCLSYHDQANDNMSIHDSICTFSHSSDVSLPRGAKHKLENLHEYSLRIRTQLRSSDKNFDYGTLSECSARDLLVGPRLTPDSRLSPDFNYLVESSEAGDDYEKRSEREASYDDAEKLRIESSSRDRPLSVINLEPVQYVRVPTPIPYDVDDQPSSSGASSDVGTSFDNESGNEAPTTKSFDSIPIIKRYKTPSEGESSIDESDYQEVSLPKRQFRKSKSKSPDPARSQAMDGGGMERSRSTENVQENHSGKLEFPEVEIDGPRPSSQKKRSAKSSSTIVRKSTRLKSKASGVSKSAENLAARKSKRHRDPERRKSDISVQTANLLRDESTNTSPLASPALSRSESRSVQVQTSFEETLASVEALAEAEGSVLGLSESRRDLTSRDRRRSFKNRRFGTASRDKADDAVESPDAFSVTNATSTVEAPLKDVARLLKISSFEEADIEDYERIRGIITDSDAREASEKRRNGSKGSRSVSSVDEDESYWDAEDVSAGTGPIQYTIPDPDRNKAFWLIFSGEYTKAMNKDWHSGHFCCWQCDESLTGQRYVLRDEHPYCIKCYESVFANGCEECNKIIGIDSKDLSYKDKHWHEACFLCNRCRVSLVDKQFGSKVDKIYCGNCYDAQFASRCDGCGEIFRAGTKKMEYKTRQWHEKCFCCVVCKNPIGTKSFIPREQEIYCAGCYEDKFATRCVKCNKIITSGGVTYKNEPWHRDCFTCSNCNNSLAGQRFTSRDDKPYCADCFGELFAKRCTACSKPITGIGGTRFISFEDRHWHNDCFICAGCKTSLVGRGFITDNEDIICPECAKMKLM